MIDDRREEMPLHGKDFKMILSEKEQQTFILMLMLTTVCLIFILGYAIGQSIAHTDCQTVITWMQYKRDCTANMESIWDKMGMDEKGVDYCKDIINPSNQSFCYNFKKIYNLT